MTANVKKCAAVVCNEDRVIPASLRWKRAKDNLPIVDQNTHLGMEISEDCSCDTHMAKVTGRGEAHVGKIGCDRKGLAH